MSAATAKTKSAETGSRQVPRFGFPPGNANLPIGGLRNAIQENGVPRRISPGDPSPIVIGWAHSDSVLPFRSVSTTGPRKECGLGGPSTVFAVPALQHLLLLLLDFVFLFGG